MARYIDADELMQKFLNTDANGINLELDRYAVKCIEDAPTADIREVKRGMWEPMEYTIIGEDPMDVKSGWRCSICHRIKEEKSWYCPNCGAEMRGE